MAARDPEGRALPAIALPLPLVDDAQSGAFGLMGVLVPLSSRSLHMVSSAPAPSLALSADPARTGTISFGAPET